MGSFTQDLTCVPYPLLSECRCVSTDRGANMCPQKKPKRLGFCDASRTLNVSPAHQRTKCIRSTEVPSTRMDKTMCCASRAYYATKSIETPWNTHGQNALRCIKGMYICARDCGARFPPCAACDPHNESSVFEGGTRGGLSPKCVPPYSSSHATGPSACQGTPHGNTPEP